MWVISKNVYNDRIGEKLISKDIVTHFNEKEHAEEYLHELVAQNLTENIEYTLYQIETVL